MNYMPEISKMLGVEIEEEFNIEGGSKDAKFKFSKDYLIMEITDVGWTRASFYLADLLNGKLKIVKLPKPILNEKEKEYLSYVFRPFKDEIIHIYKSPSVYEGYEEITVVMTDCRYLAFPAFEKNTMYKGMEIEKNYTLEELGL